MEGPGPDIVQMVDLWPLQGSIESNILRPPFRNPKTNEFVT